MKKKIILAVAVVLVAIQFVPAIPETGPEPRETSLLVREDIPAEIKSILAEACADCHSQGVSWPWYAHVAPVSFFVGHHVKEGREHFNLSEWGNYDAEKKAHKIEELEEMVSEKEMPLESYTWMHRDAQLSDTQRETLIAYFKGLE